MSMFGMKTIFPKAGMAWLGVRSHGLVVQA